MSTFLSYDPQVNAGQSLLAASQQIFLNGYVNTSVAAASTGANVYSWTSAAPGTLNVVSTANFPVDGTLYVIVATSATAGNVGIARLSYLGTTPTSFTDVVYQSGPGSSTIATNGAVINPIVTPPLSSGISDLMSISCYSDQSGTLLIFQSFDGNNWDICDSHAITASSISPSSALVYDNAALASYILFAYTNGTVAQTTFRFNTRLYSSGRQGA